MMEKFMYPEMEIILEGRQSTVDISFLSDFLKDHENLSIYTSEGELIEGIDDYEDIRNVFDNIAGLSFVNYLQLQKHTLDLSINLIKTDDGRLFFEFYFGANHVPYEKPKMLLDDIWEWALDFSKKYRFEYFICQLENATVNKEYYFDSKGKGPWYPVEG